MVVKVYISGISGNKEVKKRQQRVFMILDSKNISYNVVDITEPGKEDEKDFMQNNSKSLGKTVSDTTPRHPLPPQLFNDTEYCGDYDEFDLANEIDKLEQFLKVEIPKSAENNSNDAQEEVQSKTKIEENESVNNIESTAEKIETNGIASSREPSVESEKKTNGAELENEEEEVEAEEVKEDEEINNTEEVPEEENHKTPSEALIESERDASE